MTERGDLLLLFIQLKHNTALEYVLFMTAIRSTLMMKYFVKEWKIHCCSWRESCTNDGERGRHGLPNSRTTTLHCEIRAKYHRSTFDSENWEPPRSTYSSKKIYNRIIHLILCPESKHMIRDVGNIELCELLETEPKTQCKVCLSYWNTGMI